MSWETPFNQFKQSFPLSSTTAAMARNAAFENFLKSGLPTKKLEAWKYTSLGEFKTVPWQTITSDETHLTHDQMQELSKKLPAEFANYVFVNGLLNKTLSDDLNDIFSLQEVEATDVKVNDNHVEAPWLHLGNSFLHKKFVMHVKKNKTLDKPVQMVFVQASAGSLFSSEKIEIVMEENSEAQVLIHTTSFSNSQPDSVNLSVNTHLQASARLKLIQLQNEDMGCYHFSQNSVQIENSAQLQQLVVTTGNHLSRNYLEVDFKGENAQAEVYGVTVLDQQQSSDNYTFIRHSKGHNQSIQHYKSLLSGAAESSFRGRVRIEQNAQKANSEQLNNNLLLTKDSKANSVPQLEIYADDVKAGHGSTVGQLSQEEIFYFLSRGISQTKAIRLLSFGFVQELLFKMTNVELRQYLMNQMNEKLESMIQNV